MTDEHLLEWKGRGYPAPLQRLSARIEPGWWPGLGVSRGWWPLLARLDATVAKTDPDYTLKGVSARDGVLYFYARGRVDDIRIDDAVWEATLSSVTTCEICGAPGERYTAEPQRATVACSRHAGLLSTEEAAILRASGYPDDISARQPTRRLDGHIAASEAFHAVIARTHLSDVEIARLLHLRLNNVHGMFAAGDLAGAERDGRVAFPVWQISRTGTLLPALSRILRAFPASYAPHEVRTVMLNRTEELCDESPREWLERGQALSVVSSYIRALNYT